MLALLTCFIIYSVTEEHKGESGNSYDNNRTSTTGKTSVVKNTENKIGNKISKTKKKTETKTKIKTTKIENKQTGYSKDELVNAAYNYYIAKHGYSSIGVALDHYDGDNAVIWINEDTPERVLDLDWYTVNVYTGKGTDFLGDPIDIMNPPTTTANNYSNDEYIFPYSNSQYLTDSDLWSMSSEELRIARNEIYARHGRMFKDEALQNYFDSKSWYIPSVRPEDFNEQWLNEYEKANAKLIKSFE